MSIEEILARNAKFRADRRAKMPETCAIEAAFKDVFGVTVKVLFASENGCVVGTPTEGGVQASQNSFYLAEKEEEKHRVRKKKRLKSR